MAPDPQPPAEEQPPVPPSESDEIPSVEDASQPDESAAEVVADDEGELLDPSARALEGTVSDTDEEKDAKARQVAKRITADSDSDTESISDTDEESAMLSSSAPQRRPFDWEYETSAHNVVVELKRIELEVRQLLEDRDTRRKRKLSGTHRWRELEDDLRSWRYAGRFDIAALDLLSGLVTRRHYLFRRLRFLASTRPTWNS